MADLEALLNFLSTIYEGGEVGRSLVNVGCPRLRVSDPYRSKKENVPLSCPVTNHSWSGCLEVRVHSHCTSLAPQIPQPHDRELTKGCRIFNPSNLQTLDPRPGQPTSLHDKPTSIRQNAWQPCYLQTP